MAEQRVTLTYKPNGDFSADPPSIAVKPKDTITFLLGAGSQAGTIQVTFREHNFFSAKTPKFAETGVAHGKDGPVNVDKALPHKVIYDCDLLDSANNVIATSSKSGPGHGGEVVPSTRTGDDPGGNPPLN